MSRRRAGAFDLTTPLIGRGNLANVLAATAVARRVRRPAGSHRRSARAAWRPASRRGEVLRLANGVTVIDDSYNANPTATKRALEVLGDAGERSRRVAVLGEMLELGDRALALHEDVGRAAAGRTSIVLIAVGGEAGPGAGGGGGRGRHGARERAVRRDERRGGRRGGGARSAPATSCS